MFNIQCSMFNFRRKAHVDAEQLRRVVNLIPEYVDALIEERRTRTAALNGLDARETHGPAERKLKKVEGRIAELLGGDSTTERTEAQRGLRCSEVRKLFFQGLERQSAKSMAQGGAE